MYKVVPHTVPGLLSLWIEKAGLTLHNSLTRIHTAFSDDFLN